MGFSSAGNVGADAGSAAAATTNGEGDVAGSAAATEDGWMDHEAGGGGAGGDGGDPFPPPDAGGAAADLPPAESLRPDPPASSPDGAATTADAPDLAPSPGGGLDVPSGGGGDVDVDDADAAAAGAMGDSVRSLDVEDLPARRGSLFSNRNGSAGSMGSFAALGAGVGGGLAGMSGALMSSVKSLKKVVLDDSDDDLDADADVPDIGNFNGMTEAQQFQQVAQAMAYQSAQTNIQVAALASSATASAAAPVAAATTTSAAVKVGVTLATVMLVAGGGSVGGALLAEEPPAPTPAPVAPMAQAAPPKSPPVPTTLEPTPLATSLWPSSSPSPLPSAVPSVVPTASILPTQVQCGTYRDSASGNVKVTLAGPNRLFNDQEERLLADIFRDAYNEVVGGCDDVYLRELESLELIRQTLRPNIQGRNYIDLEWKMTVRCGPNCHPTNPLFAKSTPPPGWTLTDGGGTSQAMAPPEEGSPAANPQGSLTVPDEIIIPGYRTVSGAAEGEEEPCVEDDATEIVVAECGISVDAPSVRIVSKDSSTVTFRVDQTWRDCTGGDDEVGGWIAVDYVASSTGETTCDKTESFNCRASPRHASRCTDNEAEVDVYVRDDRRDIFRRAHGGAGSVSVPESCDPSGGDPKTTVCRFRYSLSCETKCPPPPPASASAAPPLGRRRGSSRISPAPDPRDEQRRRDDGGGNRTTVDHDRFVDVFDARIARVFDGTTTIVRRDFALI